MRERARVFQVIECGGPGGTGNQVAAICGGLDKSRFELGLVYSVRPGCAPKDYEAQAAGAKRFFHIPEMAREIRPLRDLQALWRLYRLFRDERPQIVHAHSSKAGFLARLAAWAAGVPRIFYSPRGYSFLQSDRSALSRLLYRNLERSVSWIGDIVAVSESEAALARALSGGRPVHVVHDPYLGPALKTAKNGASARELQICASGRLSYPRHPEAFARLARRLADSGIEARCLWVGDGELGPKLRGMISELKLEHRLELTGWLEQAAVLERLASSHVFVHYSRWEGIPNAVLEAMAAGLPVVASDIPGNRELVRHGETGLLAKNEEELFERTLELIRSPELRLKLGRNAQTLVRERHSRERALTELARLYSAAA